jgi:23S rRNA (guanosine2251-2'-O)-methyltransferase
VDVLYGRNAVREALRGPRLVRRVLIADTARGLDEHLAAARAARVPVDVVARHDLDRRVDAHHQGIVAEAEPFRYTTLDQLLATPDPLLLVLDSLQDPQNFGSLLRSAQAIGVAGVVIPEHRAVGVTAAVANASAGAVEHLAVARVTNLSRALRAVQSAGGWAYGLAADGQRPYYEVDLRGPVALVVGSEGAGLSRLVRETCDELVRIPMAPAAIESLNAAVAGSLVLYEAFRQRVAAV